MANPQLVVNIIGNTKALIQSLEAGRGAIEAYGPSVAKMRDTWARHSAVIIEKAALVTAGMKGISASTLTAADAAANLRTLEAGMVQLQKAGQPIPKTMQDTATELRKMQPLFSGLARQMAGMFTVGAIIGFGRQVIQAGDHIQKMADQTGMSTTEVQRLNYVAGQSGTSMESLVSAAQNLQQRLGDDNSGAAAGIRKLNINLSDFSKLRSYEQMTTLGEALRNIEDPTVRASAAAAVFGKNWKEILPAIMAGMQEMGDSATVMSDEAVKALDRAGDALQRLKGTTIVVGGGIALGFQQLFAILGGDFKEVGGLAGFLADKVDRLAPALAGIKPPAIAASAGLRDLGLSADEAARLERELTSAAEESIRVNTKLAAGTKTLATDTKKLADEVRHFNDVADAASVKGWADELARVERLAKLDRQALHDMNLELERQIADVQALALAHADAAANLYLQNELDLYLLQTAALREQAKVISDIANQNGLRQMAMDAGVEIDELVPNVQRATQSFEELAQSFALLAQVAGGSFGRVVQWIGTLTASISLITRGQQSMSAGWQKLTSDSHSAAAGLMEIAGGLAAVAAGFMQATEAGTTTQRALSGAAAGAKAGAAFGPWGAAIGAGVGALVGWYRGRQAEAEAAKAAADEFRLSLEDVMTQMQRIEAQTAVAQGANALWASTAITVRDAYLAAGLTAEQALDAVDRLWKAEKQGGDAVARVIAEIEAAMRQVPPVTRAAGDAFDRAATQGVMGFTQVQDTIRQLTTQAILSGSHSLIMAMHALETEMQAAAASGVQDFAFMASAIQAMKDQIAQAIVVPVDFAVGEMPSFAGGDFSSVGGFEGGARMGTGSDGESNQIRDFLARNPGDNARIASALGIDQATVSRLGFQSGTRNLDFQSFPSRGAFVPLHGSEAVIPKGAGHQLAAEIAAAMPFRGAVHDEALQHEMVQLRRTMERRDRTLPHLLATMIADAMATTPRR